MELQSRKLFFPLAVISVFSTLFPWVLKHHCQLIHGKFSDVSKNIVFQVRGLLPAPVYNISRVCFFFPDQKVNLCVVLKFLQRKWEDYKPYLFKLDLALVVYQQLYRHLFIDCHNISKVLPALISWQSNLVKRLSDLTKGQVENQW